MTGGVEGVDSARLHRTLGDPALGRLVRRLVRRVELGRPLTGPVTLDEPTDTERRAVRALLGTARTQRGASLTVDLAAIDEVLRRAEVAPDLRTAVEAIAGPIVSRPAVRDAEEAERDAALKTTAASRHAGARWFDTWVERIDTDGTLTRLIRRGETETVGRAVAVLDLLPADGLPLPMVAERATGDTKALAGTPLAALVLRALALRVPATWPREQWESAGVIVDDLSSQVLVLGLSAVAAGPDDGPLGGWLTEAARRWTPFRITLHQLVTMPIAPRGPRVHVCENPSVLRAAVAHPASDTALVCTEGVPSAACHRLLDAVARAGAAIHWRGDFDWTGLRTTTAAIRRYDAAPWRMSEADYTAALARGDSESLRGPAAESPWAPRLAETMAAQGRAVMEERLIPSLLTDLA